MDWRAEVLKLLKHHEDRQKEHGIASSGRPKKGVPKGWSLRDSAEELGYPLGTLSELISVAKAVRSGDLLDIADEDLARLKLRERRHMGKKV